MTAPPATPPGPVATTPAALPAPPVDPRGPTRPLGWLERHAIALHDRLDALAKPKPIAPAIRDRAPIPLPALPPDAVAHALALAATPLPPTLELCLMPSDTEAPAPVAPPASTELRVVPVLNGWIIQAGGGPVAIATNAAGVGETVTSIIRAQLAAKG